MPVAIDFGTCNTVITRWNETSETAEQIRLDSLSRCFSYRIPGDDGARETWVIPSLINYGEGDNYHLGEQVAAAGLTDGRGTFRWIKLDMLRNNRKSRRINGRLITFPEAATDLLTRILVFAKGSMGGADEELVVTVPVESYDHYVEWIRGTAAQVFTRNVRVIDEATACILGYRERVKDGELYAVFDFGGGTLDVVIVKTDLSGDRRDKCRVLGRAGEEIGGTLVDKWLLEELRSKEGLTEQDLAEIGVPLLGDLERAKIELSSGAESVDISRCNDVTGRLVNHEFTRPDMKRILSERGVYTLVARTVERAMEAAQEKYGVKKAQIKGVFMVGGSSLLLGVSERVKTLFPESDVHCDSPFEAIASGACRYISLDLVPTLVHDYFIQTWNRQLNEFELITVVPKGTQFPTERDVSRKYINGACEGDDHLKLEIYERSYMVTPDSVVTVDLSGRVSIVETGEITRERSHFLNPDNNRFIIADPPCEKDDNRRFIIGFGVDHHKRMTISLKDTRLENNSRIVTRKGEEIALPVKDFPIVKL